MEVMLDSLVGVLSFKVILLILVGTFIGIIVGALPGINAPTGIALAIPLTFTFSPAEGLVDCAATGRASLPPPSPCPAFQPRTRLNAPPRSSGPHRR